MPISRQLQRRMLIGLAFGLLVLAALVVAGDRSELTDALRRFEWSLTPLVMLLVLGNYVLRFAKWQWYLGKVGIDNLAYRDSVLIFVAGFSMAMTPGKVGELLKSYFVRLRAGWPMTRTIPVVFAERLTDGGGLLVLGAVGLLAFRIGVPAFAILTLALILAIALFGRERLILGILERFRGTRIVRGRIDELRQLYLDTRQLLRPAPLLAIISISAVSWFLECVALAVILAGLGIDLTWNLVLAATFVFAASAWIGGASLLPGGLGATEASAAALLLVTVDDVDMSRAVAASATLLLRIATLWFGVALGIIALIVVARWTQTTQIDVDADALAGSQPARATELGKDSP